MGALTKKEREALEDVFISIHSKTKYEQLITSFKDVKLKIKQLPSFYKNHIRKWRHS